ncbi:MAG TPA: stage II sporulation protein M [Thermaerobacter sp.]
MLDYIARALARHLRQHLPYMAVALLILTAGIVVGALQLVRLDPADRAQIGQYLDHLTREAGVTVEAPGNGSPPGAPRWRPVVAGNVGQVALAWGCGLLVLGLPVTLGLLFLHGYTIGFTVGALTAHWQWLGVLLALAAVFPANLLQVPALTLVAAGAVRFAGQITVGRLRRGLPVPIPPWSAYLALGGLALLLALGAGFLEAYVAPTLIRVVGRWVA